MNFARAACGTVLGSLCTLYLQGCAGNGQGLDANGRPLVSGAGGVPLAADFASIQANVFTPICTKCHIGGGAPEGLRLDAANSYSLLVGVPSTEVPSLLRVKPGDPDNSYIIQKLEGHAAVGAQMPYGGPYLPTSTIAFIRQWITNGAAPATSAAPAAAANGALSMQSIVPVANEQLSMSPPQIAVTFNHELDVTQLGLLRAQLERTGPGADLSAPTAARVDSAHGNAAVLLITPVQPLANGHYQLILQSPVAPAVSDIAGRTLALGSVRAPGESVLTQFDVEVRP
jgi:hypothetical protein